MWKLHAPSSELIEWYKNTMLKSLKNRIIEKTDKSGNLLLEEKIQRILIPEKEDGTEDLSILEQLLTDKPEELHELCDRLMGQIIPNYKEEEFERYLEVKSKTKREGAEQQLYEKYSETLKRLLQTFDYEGQLSRNKSRSYKLTIEQGHNTCTYCNRQYVIAIGGSNDASRITRPQLDHWYSKELFPLMSLSLYNLIPSCSICNGSIKGNTIFLMFAFLLSNSLEV